jgi:muconate cycloisomerase
LNGPQFLDAQVLTAPLKISEAVAHIPTGPGLGIEVDEQAVRELVADSNGKTYASTEM